MLMHLGLRAPRHPGTDGAAAVVCREKDPKLDKEREGCLVVGGNEKLENNFFSHIHNVIPGRASGACVTPLDDRLDRIFLFYL